MRVIKTGQIHCFIDCYAEVLHSKEIDFRPLYIGVWDAHFDADDDRISYSSDSLDPKEWHVRSGKLFGLFGRHWHTRAEEGEAGFHRLVEWLAKDPQRYAVMLKVDLFHMPHVPQYQMKHSPHSVVVEIDSSIGSFRVKDPYFSWEGEVDGLHLASAFVSGFIVEPSAAHQATVPMIRQQFVQDFQLSACRLSTAMERIVCRAVEHNGGTAPAELFASVQEAGVIAKRLGGYRLVLEYFAEATDFETQSVLPMIDALRKGWESLMLMIARSELLQRRFDTEGFLLKLGKLNELELYIKRELRRAFIDWAK